MKKFVLDSWALLAWLKGEDPGRRQMRAFFDRAAQGKLELWMNMIDVGEVFYLLAKRGQRERAEALLEDMGSVIPIKTLVPDGPLILEAARFKSRHPVSYADAFAAVTALSQDAPLVTGDPEFRSLPDIRLEWIGAGDAPAWR